MQIGAFAEACGAEISLIRHYDRIGLLRPEYTQPLTGYRHYSPAQVEVYRAIAELKKCGLTLAQIKRALEGGDVGEVLNQRACELRERLALAEKLSSEKNGGVPMNPEIALTETTIATMPLYPGEDELQARDRSIKALCEANFQLVAQPTIDYQPDGSRICRTEVVKLSPRGTVPCRNDDLTALPFEDDSQIVGKWQVCGYFPSLPSAEQFDWLVFPEPINPFSEPKSTLPFIQVVFLPEGRQYWCFSWTKGIVKYTTGDPVATANPYHFRKTANHEYLYIHLKDYQYVWLGGRPKWMVLRRLDNRAYTLEELARRDDINLPFVDDPAVIGRWKSCAFVDHPDVFDGSNPFEGELFWREVTFAPGGSCTAVYGGKPYGMKWTKGAVVHERQSLREEMEIRTLDGREYLFIQWKSGDYVYGGMEPKYYVFVKE